MQLSLLRGPLHPVLFMLTQERVHLILRATRGVALKEIPLPMPRNCIRKKYEELSITISGADYPNTRLSLNLVDNLQRALEFATCRGPMPSFEGYRLDEQEINKKHLL